MYGNFEIFPIHNALFGLVFSMTPVIKGQYGQWWFSLKYVGLTFLGGGAYQEKTLTQGGGGSTLT